jgi:enamine deaminase RidA (YjgF/YER057c/UK114 family)
LRTNETLEAKDDRAMGAEARLTELKLTLPPAPKPIATYVSAVRHGDLLYVSGHGPLNPDGSLHLGKLGAGLDIEAGKAAAKQTGLAILATVRSNLGSLDKVVRLIKVLGLVNSAPDFIDHPKVINGFSDLMVEVFGEPGKAARSAFGVAALPNGMAVEIEAIFEVKD